ncbi:MAG: metalloregulator ArsR/SmtB family transcription factor [Myxococcota bacterium]
MADRPSPSCVAEAFEDPLLKALSDPTRCALLRTLAEVGPADIATLAAAHPQDRSVISRHLRVMHGVGVVRSYKEGRHVVYALDGPALIARLEGLLATARALVARCCPVDPPERP